MHLRLLTSPYLFFALLFVVTNTPAFAEEPPPLDVEPLPLDVEPSLLHFAPAVYPESELSSGVEGEVILDLLLNTGGEVDSALVAAGLTPDLDAAALVAAKKFRFSPAEVGGESVPVWVQFAYEFSIDEQTEVIEDRVNFHGVLKELGTKDPIVDGMVTLQMIAPPDSTLEGFPMEAYLERVGSFAGQQYEAGRIVTLTDSTGAFSFRSIPEGDVVLRFPIPGYESFESTESIAEGEILEAKYGLRRNSYNEYEIVVYGRGEEREVSHSRLSVTEVENLPGFGGDVIKSVQALPSVARPPMTDAGAIIVRGSGNYDSRFYLEGVDIPLLFHFGGIKSTYNSLSLGSIDLYPGGYGTRYGDVVGGVVELSGRPAKTDRWHRTVDASLLDSSIHAEGPLAKNWGLMFTGRRSFIGELASAAASQSDKIDIAIAPYYWDGVARLDRKSKPGDQLFLTAFAASDRTEIVLSDEQEGSAEVNAATNSIETSLLFTRFIFGWDKQISPKYRNELRASAGTDSDNGHIFGEFDFRSEGQNYQLRDEFTSQLRDNLTARVGLDLALAPNDYTVKVAGQKTTKEKTDYSDLAFYSNFDWSPTEKLTLTPGIRYDRYTELKDGATSLRLSSRYRLNSKHTLTGSIGSYNQSPEPRGQVTDPVYGNPNIPETKAFHTTLSDEWRINDRLFLKMEGYYNRQSQIPMLTDSLDLNFVSDVDGRMYGLELMLRHEQGERFFGWVSYSLSRSERRFPRQPEIPEGTGNGSTWDKTAWQRHDFDQTHHFEALGSYRMGNNISAGMRVQYVTGNPNTPNLSYSSGQYEYDSDTGEYVLVHGAYNSTRQDPFFRVDVRVDKTFVRRNYLMSLYFDFQNISYFFYKSPEAYSYNYDYSKREEFGLIPMPSLGVRFEF